MFRVIFLETKASNWLESFIFRLNITSSIWLAGKFGEFRIFFIRLEKPGVNFKVSAMYSKHFKLVYLGNGASFWPETFTNPLNSSSSTRKKQNLGHFGTFFEIVKNSEAMLNGSKFAFKLGISRSSLHKHYQALWFDLSSRVLWDKIKRHIVFNTLVGLIADFRWNQNEFWTPEMLRVMFLKT